MIVFDLQCQSALMVYRFHRRLRAMLSFSVVQVGSVQGLQVYFTSIYYQDGFMILLHVSIKREIKRVLLWLQSCVNSGKHREWNYSGKRQNDL